jgi:hypothetical protein
LETNIKKQEVCSWCNGLTQVCPKCGGADHYAYKKDEAYVGFSIKKPQPPSTTGIGSAGKVKQE